MEERPGSAGFASSSFSLSSTPRISSSTATDSGKSPFVFTFSTIVGREEFMCAWMRAISRPKFNDTFDEISSIASVGGLHSVSRNFFI